MRAFRVSISTLGILVLIIALDCVALRFARPSDRALLDLLALPMLNILVLTSSHRRHLRRDGNRAPFLDGFQTLGWVALGSYLIGSRVRPLETARAFVIATEPVLWLTLDHLDFDAMRRLDPTFRLAWKISKSAQESAAAGILTAILTLVATCGGVVTLRRHRAGSGAAASR